MEPLNLQPTFGGVILHGDIEAGVFLHEDGEKITVRATTEENKIIHVMMYTHEPHTPLKYPISKHSANFEEHQTVLHKSGIPRYCPRGMVVAMWACDSESQENNAMHWNCNLNLEMHCPSLHKPSRVDLDLPVVLGATLSFCALRNSRMTIYPKPSGLTPTHLWLLAETSVISISGPAPGWNSTVTSTFITAIKRGSVLATHPIEIYRAVMCVYNDSVVDGFHEEHGSPQRSVLYLHGGRVTVPSPFDLSKCVIHRWSSESRTWIRNQSRSPYTQNSTPWVPLRLTLSARDLLGLAFSPPASEDADMTAALRASVEINYAIPQSADEVAKKRARVEYKDDPPILRLRPKPKNEDDENLKETAVDKACVICLNHKRTHWSVGCAHMLYCDVCVHEVVARDQWKICPTCNTRSRGLTFEPIM